MSAGSSHCVCTVYRFFCFELARAMLFSDRLMKQFLICCLPDAMNSVLLGLSFIKLLFPYELHIFTNFCNPERVVLRRMISSAYATIPVYIP